MRPLFCVFDGHCGRGAADAASTALPDKVSERLAGELLLHVRCLLRASTCLCNVLSSARMAPLHTVRMPASSPAQPAGVREQLAAAVGAEDMLRSAFLATDEASACYFDLVEEARPRRFLNG